MRFTFKHKVFGKEKTYSEDAFPSWVESWFVRDHILTLGVGESIHSDFHCITRIE